MAQTVHRDVQEYKTHTGSGSGLIKKQVKAATTNATATVVLAIPLAELQGAYVHVRGIAKRDTAAEVLRTDIQNAYGRAAAGNVTQVAAATSVTANNSSGTPTITLVANTTDQTIDVTVTGEASKNFAWFIDVEYAII
jgi:hypothetical protein